MNIIEVKNLNFSYGKEKILNDISFNIKQGDITALLGPNGSGKSTLLRCINNLLEEYNGKIYIEGKNIKKLKRTEIAKKIAFLPQESNFYFPFSVTDMVIMGRNPHIRFLNKPSKKDKEIAHNALKFLKIEHLANKDYSLLSGGQKKMVLIARAIAQNAKILLLDEPTNHLDFKNQYMILEKIYEISQAKNITCIITFHNPNLAYKYSTKSLLINQGNLIKQGNTKEILNEDILNDLYKHKIRKIKLENEAFFTI